MELGMTKVTIFKIVIPIAFMAFPCEVYTIKNKKQTKKAAVEALHSHKVLTIQNDANCHSTPT